ncbi:BTAD domain-containing putative transcriptional regulator [Nocardia goodfellowii]
MSRFAGSNHPVAALDVRIRILGPLAVHRGSQSEPVGGTRLRALLIRLALDVGRPVSSASLAETLWPGDGPSDRTNALHSAVSRLRRFLPDACLRSLAGGYVLDLWPETVDVYRFEQAAAAGRVALKNGEHERAGRVLAEALACWSGELPSEVPDFARDRLEELRLSVTEDHAEAVLSLGVGDGLAEQLAPLAKTHVYRERLQALYLRALHAEGRQAEALGAYERIRARFAEELGADPGPEMQSAHLTILRAETGRRPRGNLPAPHTSFLGREWECARVRELLQVNRLVTVTGPGGVGKTRLALEVASGRTDRAWVIDLAPVADPNAVVHVAAAMLGSGSAGLLEPPRDPLVRIAESLRAAATVLVLDSCEHVLDEVARLAEKLLGRCPELRIIATSREPLGLAGEHVFAVPPLSIDAAVRLFTDRMSDMPPVRRFDSGSALLVRTVCLRLDRLPLAIELAAARARSIPLPELNIRLDTGTEPLAGARRAAQPRHRTLRAVVAWSWDLLDPDEQALARRLAVFPGPIGIDSAVTVAAASLDGLAALTDKSLLRFDGHHYRMLTTIRDYALEKLSETEELDTVRTEHAQFFRALAEQAEPRLRAAEQVRWLTRLDLERDNLLAALRYAHEAGDANTAVRLCAALGMYWLLRGDRQAMVDGTRLALATPGSAPADAAAATSALHVLATELWSDRDVDAAVLAELSTAEHPLVVLIEPFVATACHGPARGLAVLRRRTSHPDPWTAAVLQLLHGVLPGAGGDPRTAMSAVETAIAAFRTIGDRTGLSWALTVRAESHETIGEYTSAIADLTDVIGLARELDPSDNCLLQRARIAELRGQLGDIAKARQEMEHALTSVGTTAGYAAIAQLTLADLARRDADPDEAELRLRLADAHTIEFPCVEPLFRVRLACVRADLIMDSGDFATALPYLASACTAAATASDPVLSAKVTTRLARWHMLDGQPVGAVELVAITHALLGTPEPGDPDLAAVTGDLRTTLGERRYLEAYARGSRRDTALDSIAARFGLSPAGRCATERTPGSNRRSRPALPASL